MAIQTSFAEKVTWSQDCNHRFLALLGNDGELDLALLDVKNRVRDLSLRKNNLILPIFGYRFSLAARNSLGSNEALTLFLTKAPLFLLAKAALSPEGRARRVFTSGARTVGDPGPSSNAGTRHRPGRWPASGDAGCRPAREWTMSSGSTSTVKSGMFSTSSLRLELHRPQFRGANSQSDFDLEGEAAK
jgi:hypothetical protein